MLELAVILVVLVVAVRRILSPVPVEGSGRNQAAQPWAGRIALAAVAAAGGGGAWCAGAPHDRHVQTQQVRDETPTAAVSEGFVSSNSCRACHPREYHTWHTTFHRTMTQVAEPAAVKGDFNDARLVQDGVEYFFQRRGEQFFCQQTPVDELGRRGQTVEDQLVMTTGSHHYQVYWTSAGPDKSLLAFPLAYLLEDRRWAPREAALVMPPQLSQKRVLWNGICIRCHSTHSEPRITLPNQVADTTTAELGISCEACHGPGAEHIRANQNPARRYAQHLRDDADATIVQPARLTADRSSQICGQCHSIASFGQHDWWHGHWNRYRAGEDLNAVRQVIRPKHPESLVDLRAELQRDPEFLRGRFWPDGQVRVSGREYNGLIDSKCFDGGRLSCLSCHSMHDSDPNDQLIRDKQGDSSCFQCHASHRDNIEEHTHHPLASAGSRCQNCHMPHTTYGLLKAIRSHTIDSPSVATSLSTGRPNACNQCHLDKSLGWAQQQLANWYGAKPVTLSEEQETVSAMAAWLLQGDAGQRALAAWSLGWEEARQASGDKWLPPYLAQLLVDPYPAVRYIAIRSLKRIPDYGNIEYDFVGPLRERLQVQEEVLELWRGQRSRRLDQIGPQVLIDASGELDQATFNRMLQARDDRDIDLQE